MKPAWKAFWIGLGEVLFAILTLGVGLVFLRRRPASPTPADTIVSAADAEKAKIAQEIKASSDQALADLFNKSVKKEQP